MKFEIDESFLGAVSLTVTKSRYTGRSEVTNEELIKIIKGEDKFTIHSSNDHPEFTALREMLEQQGYLRIERGWWNGDRVTKGFYLNGKRFKKGDQFPCGAAMTYHLKYK